VDWRREDSGYLAATVGIVGFVAYLIAANFGLVPSPLAPLADGAPPVVAAIQAPPDINTAVSVPPPPPRPVVDRPSASHPPAIAEDADTDRPAVRVSTTDGTSIGLTESPVVQGVAADVGSGVDKVLVTFETATGKQVVPADITCDTSHDKCTWKAKVPAVLATYTVTAEAYDRAGNVARSAPIDMSVVNTGGAVEQVGETVGRLPGAVRGAVGGLLDAVGRLLGGVG
jgi:hypothetical protein